MPWRQVNTTALRLLAEHQDPDPDEVMVGAIAAARREGLAGVELEAVESLFMDPLCLGEDTEGQVLIINGQHRIRAMLDTGATQTVLQREELITPDERPQHD
ncbi:hypothetical protein AB0I53_49565 [Saccharopolyspora sp. NPDC050389]|uniref:hypothetical protein n=1 Tax=Saccharopolyspora sp. NPDC050389 TaxID=3155516 RepID=UPI0033E422DD